MKKKKWAVDPERKIGWIIEFMKKYLKLDSSEHLVRFKIRGMYFEILKFVLYGHHLSYSPIHLLGMRLIKRRDNFTFTICILSRSSQILFQWNNTLSTFYINMLSSARHRWVDNIKIDGMVWTGLIWLRIGTSGGLL
jgi:hypothetical protein